MRLLLVEDDTALSQSLKADLEKGGFAVDTADNGEDAEFMGREEPYDAIILDLGLPLKSGLDVLKAWRDDSIKTPVIILTARGVWHEKVDGFKAGADDYLAKPFHFEELLVRINALIRRSHDQTGGDTFCVEGLTLDEEKQAVTIENGETLLLTGVEFRLLRYFMLHPGKLLSKSAITEHVYDFDSDKDSNVIEVYIKRLRKKLGRDLIQTRRGQGYVFGNKK
ncbi:Two-component transcriptional response regulator, LuxR family [hydrothermal vent metagenome]|uniref:Two-component transcriptional response regulator, LuxR family n=1 Tax=hydrothermal vent metagenome TaxID=652676 RepID=A0A3B1BXL6_9ZZZZ